MRIKTYWIKVIVFLFVFIFGSVFYETHAMIDKAALVRSLYRARLEYNSYSCASRVLTSLLNVLNEECAYDGGEMLDEALVKRFRTVCYNVYSTSEAYKLCSTEGGNLEIFTLKSPIIVDFGESLIGNRWRLVNKDHNVVLECVVETKQQ